MNGSGYVVASETCALNAVGAKLIRDIEPGEVCIIDEDGLRWHQAAESPRAAMCVFETIYFARPDSHIYGRSLHEARRRMGEVLASEQPAEADVVIPVPDTGTPGAIGYATAARLPFDQGLVKRRYIQRTFIQPDPRQREMGARLKYTTIQESLAGKRVVVVDDSIVRGTTTRNLVSLIRDAGAAEVHLRIFSPPIKWPCFYGIDMATRDQLVAATPHHRRDPGAGGRRQPRLSVGRGSGQSVGRLGEAFLLGVPDRQVPHPGAEGAARGQAAGRQGLRLDREREGHPRAGDLRGGGVTTEARGWSRRRAASTPRRYAVALKTFSASHGHRHGFASTYSRIASTDFHPSGSYARCSCAARAGHRTGASPIRRPP
ncbi:MAG: phosphoribosyltransferase family protein [Gammaproteobacteria bacterium]|nr:phosphoribosyltransferase family protein [Gammaproteobacteria bacterium]